MERMGLDFYVNAAYTFAHITFVNGFPYQKTSQSATAFHILLVFLVK